MLNKPTGRRIWSTLGPLLPVIVAVLLLQVLFGAPLRAPKTEMTYTEFKAALRAGQIQTATVGVDQISGKLAADQAADATKSAETSKPPRPGTTTPCGWTIRTCSETWRPAR